MTRYQTITWTFVLLFVIAIPLSAEPITGTYQFSHVAESSYCSGPMYFGYLPEDGIIEVATASVIFSNWDLFGNPPVPIPVPQYQDGSDASEAEILFIIRTNNIGSFNFNYTAAWFGGPTIALSPSTDWDFVGSFSMEIASIAFRQGSVGAAPLDFGQLKSLFE